MTIGLMVSNEGVSLTTPTRVKLKAISVGLYRADFVVERVQIEAVSRQFSSVVGASEVTIRVVGDFSSFHNTAHEGEQKNGCERSVHFDF